MPYFLYSLCTLVLLPFSLLRLYWRGRKAPAYRQRWRERLGWYEGKASVPAGQRVVFHAVSVGEVHAAQPLIELFLQQHPEFLVLVTTSTPTGSERVGKLFGNRVEHVYLPWDLQGATTRFVQRYQPRMLVLLETELWPNLLRACSQQQCKVVLANARLSDKSFRAYQRFPGLTRLMLAQLTLVAAQAFADGERFIELGLPAAVLRINGSLKFDVDFAPEKIERARQLKSGWQSRPVWIAASTREGEEQAVLAAFNLVLQQLPDTLLVLVPRHPERFTAVGELAQALGLKVQSFSKTFNMGHPLSPSPDHNMGHPLNKGHPLSPDTQVLLGDTMGDMVLYYSLADVAFVGGSLVPTGCQNIIEPAALGLPVLTGPSLYNFQKVSELLLTAGGMQVVADAPELARAMVHLLQDKVACQVMGTSAKNEVLRNQGAAGRLLKMLSELLH